jgi:hypothetical protein
MACRQNQATGQLENKATGTAPDRSITFQGSGRSGIASNIDEAVNLM